SRTNVHVHADKKLFSLYYESSTCTISIGNRSMEHVLGEGQVKLELSSGICLTYFRWSYKVVFESNRVVITKHGIFVCKDYICQGLFKLNLLQSLLVEIQLERKIKCLHYDRGGEYTSFEMSDFCEMHSIIHEMIPLCAPQSNEIAERKI
ncbi:hypothetical protein CR513_01224, partial [Mucuna pruriens]